MTHETITHKCSSDEELFVHVKASAARFATELVDKDEAHAVFLLADIGDKIMIAQIGSKDGSARLLRLLKGKRSSVGFLALVFSLGLLVGVML